MQLQHPRNHGVFWNRRGIGSRSAGAAGERAVRGESSVTSEAAGGDQTLGDRSAGPEVHLVRSLALKRRVRDHAVVLLDVERDESLHGGERVERVQEEPCVLQGPPERLNF